MTHTVNRLIQTVYNEFSTRILEGFSVSKLAKLAGVNRGTVYNNIGSIEDVYRVVFEKMILEEVIEECDSFEEIIISFVDYVINNKTFCLNMYYQTAFILRHQNVIDLLEGLLKQYAENADVIVRTNLLSAYVSIVESWFKRDLPGDGHDIKLQLLHYHKAIPS